MTKISRRSFVKLSGVLGAGAALGGAGLASTSLGKGKTALADGGPVETKVVTQQCTYNCGGYSCLLKLEVQNGVVTRVDTDQMAREGFPALKACPRGRSIRQLIYHPDRLKQPLKRVGKRGEGKFEPVSWDEAYTLIAENMQRIIKQYGNHAIYNNYASGTGDAERGALQRLLNLMGGNLGYYGSYSAACYSWALPKTYASAAMNTTDDLVNSRLVVMFGSNPGETRMGGGNDFYWHLQAKKRGVKHILIDPRLSESVKTLGAEWIPIRPGTDCALIAAMAYVMVQENLHDQAFLDKYCLGFNEETLPEGAPKNGSFHSYIMGLADGVAKTPDWAEKITGVPRETIIRLAREVATTKPVAFLQGWSLQRAANGEQPVRMVPVLAAMTGNVGISGGGPGGCARQGHHPAANPAFPAGANPVTAQISCFQWTEAIERGKELTPKDGLLGADRLNANIKFIWNYGGNTLLNQHSDINNTIRILQDESLCEFIVVSDIFMTPSAKFADLVIPDTFFVERMHTGRSASHSTKGDRLYLALPAIAPQHDCKNIYEVCSGVAEKLGIKEKYTQGKTWEQWIEESLTKMRATDPTFPTVEELKRDPVVRGKNVKPIIAFDKFREDPVKYPLATPSGKIEIYSASIAQIAAQRNNADELPAIPKYVPSWEGPEDPLREKYPLQCIGHHTKRRVHSTHDNNPWMEEVEPQAMYINEIDAAARGIRNGDRVRVFNDRGEIHMTAAVTTAIMPGVIDIPQGAWYTPNKDGIDTRGSINMITKYHPTPGAKGNPQHTNLVEVAKL